MGDRNNNKDAIPELTTLKNRCDSLEKNGDGGEQDMQKIKSTLAQIGRVVIWQVEHPSVSREQCEKAQEEIDQKIKNSNKWTWKTVSAIAPLWLMLIAILYNIFT